MIPITKKEIEDIIDELGFPAKKVSVSKYKIEISFRINVSNMEKIIFMIERFEKEAPKGFHIFIGSHGKSCNIFCFPSQDSDIGTLYDLLRQVKKDVFCA